MSACPLLQKIACQKYWLPLLSSILPRPRMRIYIKIHIINITLVAMAEKQQIFSIRQKSLPFFPDGYHLVAAYLSLPTFLIEVSMARSPLLIGPDNSLLAGCYFSAVAYHLTDTIVGRVYDYVAVYNCIFR